MIFRSLSTELFDSICSGGQQRVLPQLFLQRNLAKEDDGFFYRSGQSDLDEVEESSVSHVAN